MDGSCGKFSNARSRALSGTNTAAPIKDRNLFTRKKWKSRDFPIKGKMPRDSAFPDCFKRQACTELSQSSSISLKLNRGRFSSYGGAIVGLGAEQTYQTLMSSDDFLRLSPPLSRVCLRHRQIHGITNDVSEDDSPSFVFSYFSFRSESNIKLHNKLETKETIGRELFSANVFSVSSSDGTDLLKSSSHLINKRFTTLPQEPPRRLEISTNLSRH